MSISTKIMLSLAVIVVGAIITGVIRDMVGAGQYIATGIIVVILFYIWGKSSPVKTGVKGEGND